MKGFSLLGGDKEDALLRLLGRAFDLWLLSNEGILTSDGFLSLPHACEQRLLGGDEEDALLGLLGRAHAQLPRQEVHATVGVLCADLRSG